MKLIKNTGTDRVVDELRQALAPPASLDVATPMFSLFAFSELRDLLEKLDACRVVLGANGSDLGLTGSESDRAFRNHLNVHWLARECAAWALKKVELRAAPGALPQSVLIAGGPDAGSQRAITGNCAFSTEGLGVTPGNQFSLIQCSEKTEELAPFNSWFRWRQDLTEDRNRLATLLSAARQVGVARDAKLKALKEVLTRKCREPLNPGNRKVLVFTAFADTAKYLYQELSGWARNELDLHSALVTGTGQNQTTLQNRRKDFVSIITAFSPRSKERPDDLASDGEVDLLIATDCVSEGQNLQDCDTVVNYDIHWNPVRIIQRFGRIDRLGSPNTRIQLVNFWPNIELEEYINLEQRVSGRMVLLDISATGEENIIEHQSGDQMNDLEYRRKQLLKLQDAVIDLEDLSSGVSIADLTLNDFRIDLAGYLKEHAGKLESLPLGTFAVTSSRESGEATIPSGVIFCLRAVGDAALKAIEPSYPLTPHYVVHVGDDGAVLLAFTQAKQVLDRIKRLCIGRDLPDAAAYATFDKTTRNGKDMSATQELLATAVASIVGKKEERAIASLFTTGGTHAMKGEFQGINDFEVVAFLVVLPEPPNE